MIHSVMDKRGDLIRDIKHIFKTKYERNALFTVAIILEQGAPYTPTMLRDNMAGTWDIDAFFRKEFASHITILSNNINMSLGYSSVRI